MQIRVEMHIFAELSETLCVMLDAQFFKQFLQYYLNKFNIRSVKAT